MSHWPHRITHRGEAVQAAGTVMVGPNAACGEPIRGSFGDADYWVSIIRYVDDSGGIPMICHALYKAGVVKGRIYHPGC